MEDNLNLMEDNLNLTEDILNLLEDKLNFMEDERSHTECQYYNEARVPDRLGVSTVLAGSKKQILITYKNSLLCDFCGIVN